jgi:aryl-alcohol dehydrogenase-like predicted oxidoreductase
MRYRHFNRAGLAVSAITLTLGEAAASSTGRLQLIFAALELGINSFELACGSPDCTEALRAAIEAAGRNVLALSFRASTAPSSKAPSALEDQIRTSLEQMGAAHFDAVLLDAADQAVILNTLRAKGLARMGGVVCGRDGPDMAMIQAGYDLFATPFGLRADAGLRKRLRAVVDQNITLIGYDYDDVLAAPPQTPASKGLGRLFKRSPGRVDAGPYEFLHRSPGWTAEELALAYALTEPSFATIRIQTTDIATLNLLAKAVERELPAGAAAQIEMARFSAPA